MFTSDLHVHDRTAGRIGAGIPGILRVGQARIMLIEFPERRAWEIGRACGFESPSYFGETFKRVTGMTPAEYRLA